MWTRRMLVTSAKSFDLKKLLLDNRCLCRLIHKRISNLKLGWIILKEKEYFPLHINRLLMVCFVVQFWRMHSQYVGLPYKLQIWEYVKSCWYYKI